MFPTGEEVKLVAEVSVSRPGNKVEHDAHQGDVRHQGCPGGEQKYLRVFSRRNRWERICTHAEYIRMIERKVPGSLSPWGFIILGTLLIACMGTSGVDKERVKTPLPPEI
jgi:hypothetical protein